MKTTTAILIICLAPCMTSCRSMRGFGTWLAVSTVMAPLVVAQRITETKDERAERLRWKADRKASEDAWRKVERGEYP